jgi:hypothetical protein
MKPIVGNRIKRFIMVVLLVLMLSCATAPETKQRDSEQILDMGTYSVSVPPVRRFLMYNYKWEIQSNKEKGTVAFQSVNKNIYGEFISITLIQVYRNLIPQEGWNLSEEQTADDYRNLEERIMSEKGVKKGLYNLEAVKKDVSNVGGKKLYTMSYKKTIGKGFFTDYTEFGVLYIYFPPDFKEKHHFFCFLTSEGFKRASSGSELHTSNVGIIHHVINSLKIYSP